MYGQLIAFGLVGALSFTGAWSIQNNRYEAKINQMIADQATAVTKAVEKANAETIRLQKQVDTAQRLARQRQSDLAIADARNRDVLIRLSHAADSALRDAHSSHTACITRASAFSDIFGSCSKQLTDLGKEADRIASDKQTLIEGWPK